MQKNIRELADEMCVFLEGVVGVKKCSLYGSIANDSFDEYSDIDIEIDVSGENNGEFLMKLSGIIREKYNVILCDFAPSLAPQKYVMTSAVWDDMPFCMVDISCTATPHCTTVSKRDLASLNNMYDHTLKLFSANLKHFLRGDDCTDDVTKMYTRIFGKDIDPKFDVEWMLRTVYIWLEDNAELRHEKLVSAFGKYIA